MMHKLTISNLDFKENINDLKIFNENDFSNMIDSMIVFLQSSKISLTFQKYRKIKNDNKKDEYSKVIKMFQRKTYKIKQKKFIVNLFIKPYDYTDISVNNFWIKFSLTPNILKIYLENMKIILIIIIVI